MLYNVYHRTHNVADGFTRINSTPMTREKAEEWKQYLQEKNANRVYFLRPHRAAQGHLVERVSVC
jgi:hypothetical protein